MKRMVEFEKPNSVTKSPESDEPKNDPRPKEIVKIAAICPKSMLENIPPSLE